MERRPGSRWAMSAAACFHVPAGSSERSFNLHEQRHNRRCNFDLVRFPARQNFGGLGPHHLREFRLWLEVNRRNGPPRAEVEMKEGVVELHGAKRG